MVFRILTILFITVYILLGCSSNYQWSKSHPLYNKAPYTDIALTGIEDAFVLTRSAWFAKKFEWNPDSIQLEAISFCIDVFINEFKRIYPSFTNISDNVFKNFPEESQKLDERIFMKGRLPDQGIIVKDNNGNTPKYILILHEFIIGTDLKREFYFDYALIHNESNEKKTSKNLSAIISYTLWDNEFQRPLYSAVDEIHKPILKPTPQDLEILVRMSVKQIRINLYGGVL